MFSKRNSTISKFRIRFKHRKNCECCPRHSLFKGHNVIVNIVVLNCQKCNQCLKCQVSGHESQGLLFKGVLLMSLSFPKIWNFSNNLNFVHKSEIKRGSVTQSLQELRMLSSVSLNCQIKKIVMNSGSQ